MTDSEILLKLKRQYSKDETVSLLLIEIGKLKSENAELQYRLEQQKEKLKHNIEQQKEIKQQNELLEDEAFIKLPTAHKKQFYVTAKRYQKQVKLTDYFIDLYHKEKEKLSRIPTISSL